MKIIKNNYNESTCECEKCGSVLCISEDDYYMDENNNTYWRCPLCKAKNIVKEPEITIETIKFPESFHEFLSEEKGGNATEIKDEETNDWIKECLKFLRRNPDETFRHISSGDTFVAVFKHYGDDEYLAIVSKDHYECIVPFQDEDFEYE